MGVSAEDQETIWTNWGTLADDVKASWIDGFKKVDKTNAQDIFTYAQLLIDLLLINFNIK